MGGRGCREHGETSAWPLDGQQNRLIPTKNGVVAVTLGSGNGPPVVLIHGNSSSRRIWRHQIDCLRRVGRRVIAIDLPGHGESTDAAIPMQAYSFPGYAEVVRHVLDVLCVRAVVIVGWSLGGHIGLELLATDDRLRALMIIGSPPARPSADVLDRVFFSSPTLNFASQIQLSEAEVQAYAAAMHGGPQWVTEDIRRDIRRTDGRARQCMFANALNGVGTDQRLTVETISKPLCIVHGENEAFVRRDYLQTLQYRSLCDGRIRLMRGTGHAPHWQHPYEFNTILLGFLARYAPGDRLEQQLQESKTID